MGVVKEVVLPIPEMASMSERMERIDGMFSAPDRNILPCDRLRERIESTSDVLLGVKSMSGSLAVTVAEVYV